MGIFSHAGVKKMLIIIVSVAMALFFVSCSDSGDDPDQPAKEMSGDSALRVDNSSEWDATVYFDGDYIGTVGSHSTRDWDVPVGSHTVTVDNAEEDNSEEVVRTVDFDEFTIYILTVDWIAQYT